MFWFKAGLGFVAAVTTACGRIGFDVDDTPPRGDATAYANAVLADGPVAYFPFDETSGELRDVVGNILGDPDGAFVFAQPGAMVGSTALQFDGVSTRIDLGSHFELSGANDYTLEMWIRPTTVHNTRFLVDRRTDAFPTNGYTVYFGDDYLLSARITDGNEMSYVDDGAAPPVNHWTYLVVTHEYPLPRLYVNGVLVAENEGGTSTIGGGLGHFVIGDTTPAQMNKYDGRLDELAIYQRALSETEIAEHWRIARQ